MAESGEGITAATGLRWSGSRYSAARLTFWAFAHYIPIMPRPVNERCIRYQTSTRAFKPAGIPVRDLESVMLGFDELEAVRLADLDGLYQEAASIRMGVSRQTFGRIVESARRKIADAVVNGKRLRIEGGEVFFGKEGDGMMKIAVPARGDQVDGHFGHCEHYDVYTLDGQKKVTGVERVDPGQGCGCKSNIATVLAKMGVTHMVAGNMGDGAVHVLHANGIEVTRGASGNARAAVEAFAAGTLADSMETCAGHGDHGGDCHK